MIAKWPSVPPPSVVGMVAALVLSSSLTTFIVSYIGVLKFFVSVVMGNALMSLSMVLMMAVLGAPFGSSFFGFGYLSILVFLNSI